MSAHGELEDLESALATNVTAAATGDQVAFGRLVGRTRNLVCSIAFVALRDVAASEEIAQEVYLDAWTGLPRLRDPRRFVPWLRQLARNHCADAVARRRRMDAARSGAAVLSALNGADSTNDTLEAQEQLRALADALATLPEDSREAVILYYREGRSVAQVAALLELSPDAVKQRLSRARGRLRASMLELAGEAALRTAPKAAFATAVGLLVARHARAASVPVGALPVAKTMLACLPAAGLSLAMFLAVHGAGPATPTAAPAGAAATAEAVHRPARAYEPPPRGRTAATPARPRDSATPPAIDRAALEAAFRALRPAVKACYDRTLAADPSVAGRITLELSLFPGESAGAPARVEQAKVTSSEAHAPELERCVLAQMAQAWFPSPGTANGVTVAYPFTFDPGVGFGGTAP